MRDTYLDKWTRFVNEYSNQNYLGRWATEPTATAYRNLANWINNWRVTSSDVDVTRVSYNDHEPEHELITADVENFIDSIPVIYK